MSKKSHYTLERFLLIFLFLFSSATLLLASAPPPPPPPPPCDYGWSWAAVPSPPQSYAVSIADAGGNLFAFTTSQNSTVFGIMEYNITSKAWTTIATSISSGGQIIARGNSIYIAGSFDGFYDASGNFINAKNVARYDISLNAWYPVGSGTPSNSDGSPCWIESMAVDSQGKIYLGLGRTAPLDSTTGYSGMFVYWDQSVQQWLSVGGGLQLDSGATPCSCSSIRFNATPAFGVTALTADGTDIYVAGYFKTLGNGSASYHLAKWSGSTHVWTAIAPDRNWCYFDMDSADPYISCLTVFSNRLYVGGDIDACSCASILPPVGLAEFSTTGGGLLSNASDDLWGPYYTSFDGSTGYDIAGCSSLCILNCNLYVGGGFESIGASGGLNPMFGITKKVNFGSWSGLSNLGSTLQGLTFQGQPSYASILASDPDGDPNHVYVLGAFDAAGGIPANNLAVWESDVDVGVPIDPSDD